MMKEFPDKIVFPGRTLTGTGQAAGLLPECVRYGRRGILAHGRSLARSGTLAKILNTPPSGMSVAAWEHTGGEPTLTDLSRLLKQAREHKADWIAGVGGGSVLDLAKACAGLFHASEPVKVYHDGAQIETPGIPFAAVPTTAGTGSEATVNAVFTNETTLEKKSFRADSMMARLVILDHSLLAYCPQQIIAYSGMDAFTQALEAFTSRRATWLSDELGLKALSLIGKNLEMFHNNPSSASADHTMTGSYLAGLSFGMAGLGIVHGIAHPLGVRYHVPHGYVCGVCLPHAVEMNRASMGGKYARASDALGWDLLDFIRDLLSKLDMPSPFKGKTVDDKDIIIRQTLAARSTKTNSKPVNADDVEWLLTRLF